MKEFSQQLDKILNQGNQRRMAMKKSEVTKGGAK